MTLMGALKEQLNDEKQQTENGAIGYKTSGRHLLDLNFAVGSMRNWGDERILREYKKAYYEQPLLAVKWLFYLRDIRGIGMGERHVFQICMHWLMEDHFEEVSGIIGLIPEYGRFDDWLARLDTKAKDIIISKIMYQLEQDLQAMREERPASLLAKWLPSCNTSSASTRKLGKIVCQSLGFTERTYRKMLASLRAYIDVVEVKMSSEAWEDIDYSKDGRSSDKTVATNQFEDYARGDFEQLSREDGFANYDKACGVPEEDAYVMSDETRAAVEENVFGIYDGTKYNNDSDEMPEMGADNGLQLADLTGKDYDDADWDKL